jgi:hypothetical protein
MAPGALADESEACRALFHPPRNPQPKMGTGLIIGCVGHRGFSPFSFPLSSTKAEDDSSMLMKDPTGEAAPFKMSS